MQSKFIDAKTKLSKRTLINCNISKDTKAKMNKHIAQLGTLKYVFINEAILEKLERDSNEN